MRSDNPLQWTTSGLFALSLFTVTASAAGAADISVTDARISGGQLIVTGKTATPNTWVRLDGQIDADFNQKSGADGVFAFGIVYHPGDCIVDLQKIVSPATLGSSTAALVADCGPAGVSPRGAWSQAANYVTNDLVTYQGSTWRARRANSHDQPAAGADWEIFAAGAAASSQQSIGPGGDPSVAPDGPAGGDLAGNYPNPVIKPAGVTTGRIADHAVSGAKIAASAITVTKIAADAVTSGKVLDETLTASDIGPDAIGSSEIAPDSIGSSEIVSGVVGADELESIHEHSGPDTNISDATAHDGSYALSTQTVSCGTGEDLLSVSVDWTATGSHNERVFLGVKSIVRGATDSATVEVAYDGGGTIATYHPVATCIF